MQFTECSAGGWRAQYICFLRCASLLHLASLDRAGNKPRANHMTARLNLMTGRPNVHGILVRGSDSVLDITDRYPGF